MSFNLLDQLSAEDKKKIENYISLYGTASHFIGVDEWLVNWAKNKIKLYKLLGGQFIYRVPFQYDKPEEELRSELYRLIDESEFISSLSAWLVQHQNSIPRDIVKAIRNMWSTWTLIEDKTNFKVKFKREGAKKGLQLQAGMKPMRALSKIVDYFKGIDNENFSDKFEDFRIKHSLILNDKVVKGNMVISIHPLDFITMSDNASNWQSCMSWQERGCYHVGTIEMMNSNNVVCCYLEGKEPFHFNKEDESEEYTWTNKKWRQLLYVTKDIIVSGKPYPFVNDALSQSLVTAARNLAKENLGWEYSFGIEPYQDMKHINGTYSMNRVREFIRTGDTRKHNILFDTKGMYNDMLNDSYTKYWCVRNKVKHNKIISYSGKANCLCCGGSIINAAYDEYDSGDYNDRYENTGSAICDDCLNTYFYCDGCNCSDPRVKHHQYINSHGKTITLCESCWKERIKVCPCCGEPMRIRLDNREFRTYARFTSTWEKEEVETPWYDLSALTHDNAWKTVKPIYAHFSCLKKTVPTFKAVHERNSYWSSRHYEYRLTPVVDKDKYKDMYYENLKDVEPIEDIVIRGTDE